MHDRGLGPQSLSVSSIGLGCMGMSEFYGAADQTEAEVTLLRAVELGITHFDTADVYGPFTNEPLVGRVLRPYRDRVVLATKFGLVRGADGSFGGTNGRPEYVPQACEASLQRLGTDVIDLYYLHRVDPAVPVEETWGALSGLVADGKVRYLGLSEATPAEIERAHAIHPVTAFQMEYSLWSRDAEAEVLPLTRRLGVGFVAYAPLGRGFLTGAVTSRSDLAADDLRRGSPRFEEPNLERNQHLATRVRELADELRVTPAQLALAWLLAQRDDIVAIPGTKRRAYLEENAAAADIRLGHELLRRVDQAIPPGLASGDRYVDMEIRL